MPTTFSAEPELPECKWVDIADISRDRLEWARVRALRETDTQLLLCTEDLAASTSTEAPVVIDHPVKAAIVTRSENTLGTAATIARKRCNTIDGTQDAECDKPHFNGGATGTYQQKEPTRVSKEHHCKREARNLGQWGICALKCTSNGDCPRTALETCQEGYCVEKCNADYGGDPPWRGWGKIGNKPCSHPANPFCNFKDFNRPGYCVSSVPMARYGRSRWAEPKAGGGNMDRLLGAATVECPPGHVATGMRVWNDKSCVDSKNDEVLCGSAEAVGTKGLTSWVRGVEGVKCQRIQEAADPENDEETVRYIGCYHGSTGDSHVVENVEDLGKACGRVMGHQLGGREDLDCPKGYALSGMDLPVGSWVTGTQGFCRKLLKPDQTPVTTMATDSSDLPDDNRSRNNFKGNVLNRHDGTWMTGMHVVWNRAGVARMGPHMNKNAQSDRTIDQIVAEDVVLSHRNAACGRVTTDRDTIFNEGARIGAQECLDRAAKRCCDSTQTNRCGDATDAPAYTLLGNSYCTHDGTDSPISEHEFDGDFNSSVVTKCKRKCDENPDCAGIQVRYNKCTLLKHVAASRETVHGRGVNAMRCFRRNTQASDKLCTCMRSTHWTQKYAKHKNTISLPHKCDPQCANSITAYDPTENMECAIENFCAQVFDNEAGGDVAMDVQAHCQIDNRPTDTTTGTTGGTTTDTTTGGTGTTGGTAGTGTTGGTAGTTAGSTAGSTADNADDADDDGTVLIVVIISIVLLACVGGWYVYSSSSSSSDSSSSDSSSSDSSSKSVGDPAVGT